MFCVFTGAYRSEASKVALVLISNLHCKYSIA